MIIVNKFFQIVFVVLIRAYQYALSPVLGASCRFYPSCSEYACQAIKRHGPLNGLLLALKRILRCHPFHPGGVDPVPRRITPRTTLGQTNAGRVVKRNIIKICDL